LLIRAPALISVLILLAVSAGLAGDGVSAQPAKDSIVLSNVHLWKGHEHLRQGRKDLATESYLKASQYMRSAPEPHFALARIYLKRSFMDAFLEFSIGLKCLITDFFYQSLFVSNALTMLLIAFALSLYVALLIILIRHLRTIWLAIMITLSSSLKGSYIRPILMGSVLALIIILSGRSLLGIATWMIVVGCGLAWRFASGPEKRIIVLFLIFMVGFGFILGSATRILSTQHPASPLRLVAMADRLPEKRLADLFRDGSRSSRYEPIGEFMQGIMHIRAGEYALAIERFNVASKLAPNNAAILNNLGVALHGMGRFERARTEFRNAIRVAPREALIHYNYSQTLNALLYYDLAQDELSKASTLDFDLTRSLVTQKSESALIPMNLQTRVLWQMALSDNSDILNLTYHPVESDVPGRIILVILTIAAAVLMWKARCPARCEICGCLIQVHVAKRRRKDLLCRDCERIKSSNASDNDDLDRELEARLNGLLLRKLITRIIAGLVVPGSTYQLCGKRFKGLMISIGLHFLIILAVTGGFIIQPVPKIESPGTPTWPIIVFVFFYGIYAWRSTLLAIRSVRED
jgi:Tfp pilus assembly protein PilF